MATLQELREQQKVLAAQIKAAEAEELAKAQKVVEDKIDNLSDEQKQFIETLAAETPCFSYVEEPLSPFIFIVFSVSVI